MVILSLHYWVYPLGTMPFGRIDISNSCLIYCRYYYNRGDLILQHLIDPGQLFAYNLDLTMKKDLHPTNYRLVVFEDLNDGTKILTRSTVASEVTTKYTDGKEYPVVKVHISSSSHPFYTGQEKLVDIEGRVDKFRNRREAAEKARKAKNEKSAKAAEPKEEKKAEPQKIG
jgi:large subunit ribosomal protein L31